MNIQTPAKVAANRTARLVAEAAKPVYSSTRKSEYRKFLAYAESRLCTDEWCFVCSRATDHFAEHDAQQILDAAHRMGIRR